MASDSGIIESSRLDFDRLRARQALLDHLNPEVASDALPSFRGKVVSGESSIKLGQFCQVVPSTVLGLETEGIAGIFASNPTGYPSVWVYLLGSFVPNTGDYLICRRVDHRWVAEATGGATAHGAGGIVLPSCFCSVPAVLRMTSGDESCNYGMFRSCVIQYGPPPPSMQVFGFTTDVFTSAETFVDPISQSSFYYYFSCMYNQFFLSRIFPTSPMGSPYRDGLLYTWIVGGYGNTCDPFSLELGMAFPGSDATCSVFINAA